MGSGQSLRRGPKASTLVGISSGTACLPIVDVLALPAAAGAEVLPLAMPYRLHGHFAQVSGKVVGALKVVDVAEPFVGAVGQDGACRRTVEVFKLVEAP